jgi:hypothetical protein
LDIQLDVTVENESGGYSAGNLLVIGDHNSKKFTASAPDDRPHPGYMGWYRPGVKHKFAAGQPLVATMPRDQWPAAIQASYGNFLSDMLKQRDIHAKDQDGLSLCWCYGSTRTVECKRILMGLPFTDLSPESVAGPCTGWHNEGGYASEAFNQIEQAGICESSYMDAPHSLRPSRWKTGWQDNAKLHCAVQWYEIGTSFDQVMTCLINRLPVAAGLDWWGHLVCFLDPVMFVNGKLYSGGPFDSNAKITFGVLFQNSWGDDWPTQGARGYSVLSESKATPDGAASPIVVTAA